MSVSLHLDLSIISPHNKNGYRLRQSCNTGSIHACKCTVAVCGRHLSKQPVRWDDGGRAGERFLMRQKNSDGAEVVWNDPEEGHIQRPPSGVHCSVCSCSPGKPYLVVEIYGRSCGGLHLHALTLHLILRSTNPVICFGSYSTVLQAISTTRTTRSCFLHWELRKTFWLLTQSLKTWLGLSATSVPLCFGLWETCT